MTQTLRLGTRGSLLARTQSGQVAAAITAATGRAVELVLIRTTGDRITDRPLPEVGGKGLFTKEIERALLEHEVDFAVHSMKDMPTDNPRELTIACTPERVDPRDAMIGARLQDLGEGAVVGTGSVRRALQLRAVRPDLEVRGIRGNVDTRIEKQRSGAYDAVVLAMAGLRRLGRTDVVAQALDVDTMIPAVGQGALAVQCRRGDRDVISLLESIHHEPTAQCVAAERAFLTAVSGGCSAPAACHAVVEGSRIRARAIWAAADQAPFHTLELSADALHVHALGTELARRLMAQG